MKWFRIFLVLEFITLGATLVVLHVQTLTLEKRQEILNDYFIDRAPMKKVEEWHGAREERKFRRKYD